MGRLAVPALAGFLSLLSGICRAQTTGTIDGTVIDPSGSPLPGVSVEVASPSLQGIRTAVTAADGRFRAPSLPPGSYTVTADLPGFRKVQKKATVTFDHTETVALQMSLSATAEVTVTGDAPVVDAASTTTGTSYTAETIKMLPIDRNYANVVLSQPGAQTDNGATQGRAVAISVYGSTSAENQWIIDGANTTNVVYGIQGKDINTEFIQEIEVKTGGYQAEYGRNTGGLINAVTKSGGNEFHGGAFGYYDNANMVARQIYVATPNFSESGDVLGGALFPENSRQELGADVGGFILKDRIWFFAGYDRVTINQETSPTSGPVQGQRFPIDIFQNKWAFKLTFNLQQSTTLVGSYLSDPQTVTGAISTPEGTNPTTYEGRQDFGGVDYAARLNQLFGSVGILTLQYSHHEDRFKTTPLGANIPSIVDDTPTAFGGTTDYYGGYGRVFGEFANNASTRNDYAGSFTSYVQNNELKVGGDYQKDDTFGSSYFTGGSRLFIEPCTQQGAIMCDLGLAPSYTNRYGQTIQVYYAHRFFAVSGQDLTPVARDPFNTPTNRWSGFIQDQWRVLPALTVNVGVRYDSEDLKRSDGVTAFKLTGEWAPRIGVVWDFVGDGTSKLYASAGRFYYSLPTDINILVFNGNTRVLTYNYSPSLTSLAQDPNAPLKRQISTTPAEGDLLDPGLKADYQDELTLGVEKALDPSLAVGLKGTYRTLGQVLEDRCDLNYNLQPYVSCALMNPGGTGPAARGQIPTCDGSVNPTDPTAGQCFSTGAGTGPGKRIFRGIEASARKQISNSLWAQASFLYSTLRGNYSGAVMEATGLTDPGVSAAYDYPQLDKNAYGNLELDRTFQTRVDAVYNAPFGLSAGLQFWVRSGTPISRYGLFNYGYGTQLYLDPRGTVYGVEQRTPTDYEMNFSLSYNANIGPVTVTPMLYIFNLLNRQTPTAYDQAFNPNGSFVTNPASAFYGHAGVEPGTPGPDGTICNSSKPCTDNINYMKITGRTGPRALRLAIKVTF